MITKTFVQQNYLDPLIKKEAPGNTNAARL
jgi:hypothetical protein